MNDSYLILGVFGTLLVLVGMIAFVVLLYKGIIKDEDKDFIPDAVEEVSKEIAERADAVAEEISEAIDAAKGKKKKK